MTNKFLTFVSILSASLLFFHAQAETHGKEALDHMLFGVPYETDLLLSRQGFSLGYSKKHRQALWVSYILTSEHMHAKRVRRSNKFRVDPEVKILPVKPGDYNRSGYDRGHLAPAADMTYSFPTMKNSFFMTNISPQIPGCNRGIWKRLEKQIRRWAIQEKQIYVITGPIFSNDNYKYLPSSLPVPSAFYKVVLDMTPPYKMAAFIIPNLTSKKRIFSFAASVDEVEKLTGLDFFSSLPDELENALEKHTDINAWQRKK